MNILKIVLLFIFFFFISSSFPKAQQFAQVPLINPEYPSDLIINYDIDIIVNQDRSLNITENIEIFNSDYGSIQRGIFRDFPTLYKTKYGFLDKVDLNIISVKRDGEDENYSVENIEKGKRIRIGDEYYFLPVGKYLYTIEYTMDKQIRSFKDKDELYFNLVGTEWEFLIKNINARIHFPKDIREDSLSITGYSGKKGSADKNFEYFFDEELSVLNVNSKGEYAAFEGLTISVGFPKGFVYSQDFIDGLVILLRENLASLMALVFSLFLFGYYGFVWKLRGRDPKSGTIIPLYEPPNNLSPAKIRYLDRLGFDEKVLTVGILDIAIKGYWKIVERSGKFELNKLSDDVEILNSEQLLIASSFFTTSTRKEFVSSNVSFKLFGMEFKANLGGGRENGNEFKLNQSNSTLIQSAVSSLRRYMQDEVEKKYMISNTKYYLIGFLFYIFSGVLIFLESAINNNSEAMGLLFFVFFWNGIVSIFMFGALIPGWVKVVKTGKGIFSTIFLSLFLTPFNLVGIFVIWLAYTQGVSLVSMLALFIPIPIFVIFYKALKVRNLEGVKLQNQIDGFKMFLKATENEQLKFFNKILPHTFETYQKYLPYAVALELETQWTEKFTNEIQLYSQNHDDTVGWYSGSVMAFSSSSFASNLSSSISSSISSSSSSGSSGGSSGGGGGGGGGGGW